MATLKNVVAKELYPVEAWGVWETSVGRSGGDTVRSGTGTELSPVVAWEVSEASVRHNDKIQ